MISIFTKTLRYNLSPEANPANVANKTQNTVGTTTVYIPENEPTKPVNITSAVVHVVNQDESTLTGASSIFQVSASVNGAAWSAIGDASSLSGTGENWSLLRGPYNFTSHFASNWGSNNSASVSISTITNITTGTGTGTRAHYSWLELTYEYSASATNRGQTVCIPLPQVNTGSLPVTQQRFANIPNISGSGGLFSGYNNFIVRDAYIELSGNSCVNNSATDMFVSYSFDSAAGINVLPTKENALASDNYCIYHIPYPSVSCSAEHTMEIWCTPATRFTYLSGFLYVTGEYNPSGMTSFVNNITIPVNFSPPLSPATGNANNYFKQIRIAEPSPIAPVYTAVQMFYNVTAISLPQIKCFNQPSYRAYDHAVTQVAGQMSFLHHVSQSHVTLNTGSNDVYIDFNKLGASQTTISGLLHIVYTSGVYVSGSDYHSRIVRQRFYNFSSATLVEHIYSGSYSIIEPNYYIHDVCQLFNIPTALYAPTYLSYQAEQLTTENYGHSWREVYSGVAITDAELSNTLIYAGSGDYFKRFPGDYDTRRLSITQSRQFKFQSQTIGTRIGSTWLCSYHNITYNLSGQISNSSGSSVILNLIQSSSNEVLEQTSVTGNSTYNFDTYCNEDYYVVAYENNSYKGRSKTAKPGGGFDISLSEAASEHSYTWVG